MLWDDGVYLARGGSRSSTSVPGILFYKNLVFSRFFQEVVVYNTPSPRRGARAAQAEGLPAREGAQADSEALPGHLFLEPNWARTGDLGEGCCGQHCRIYEQGAAFLFMAEAQRPFMKP